MKKLFLAWQDSVSRAWFPVGQLTFTNSYYQFTYIQGAKTAKEKCGFPGVFSFPDWNKVYRSSEVFPIFSNRIMRQSRPEYPQLLSWLNFPEDENDPIALLSRSGGKRVTDNFEVFPYPEPDENEYYHFYFFSHGLRYMQKATDDRIINLQPQEQLYFMHDLQNSYDNNALMLRTEDYSLLGYCPRYLLDDLLPILQQFPHSVEVTVEKINLHPAPLKMRLLCHMIIKKSDFKPFSSHLYKPLVEETKLYQTPELN